jgi:hypothetical protein
MHLAIARRFFQKTDVPAVQHVETAADENFLFWHKGISRFSQGKTGPVEIDFHGNSLSEAA